MLVSVIIPVYNSEKTINRCIESVINSIEKITTDYEIICINDGSTDSSLNLLNEYAAKNSKLIVIQQENSGAAAARNKGLEIAKGEFIAFNDSDDEWMYNHFEILYNIIKNDQTCDCISANHDIEKQKTFFLKKLTKNLYKVTLNAQQFKNRFSPPNSILRKSIIQTGIRFNPDMKGSEEFYFYNHILYSFNCLFLNQKISQSILHKMRYGECGLSGNLREMEKGELFAIADARKNLDLNLFIFISAYIFSYLKYLRRCLIVKRRKINK